MASSQPLNQSEFHKSIYFDIIYGDFNNLQSIICQMNFEFAEQINADLETLDFVKALQTVESELRKLPETEFHEIIGKSLTNQADDLSAWVEDFYNKASNKIDIKALYFEMNEFDINTELWYIDSFAYSIDGGLDLDDMEWLSEFDTDSQTETETVFAIQGYEKLQSAFKTVELSKGILQDARDWSEQIIITRFMELMRAAHLSAKVENLKWAAIPIYFTEHSYDFIVKSEAH
jgi:hypothetical protein